MTTASGEVRALVGRWTAVAVLVTVVAACGDDVRATDAVASSTTEDAASSSTTEPGPLPELGGQLMFSRFNETKHEFTSTHIANPDGSGEVELTLPGPEGGGRWSSDGQHIAVMTLADDGRVTTAILTPEGGLERVLGLPDPTINLVCVTWSPDDTRLACEGWDDGDPSRTGMYVVNASDGQGLVRVTTPPPGRVDFPGDFLPDGRSLIFNRVQGEADGPLFVVDVIGGEPRQLGDGEYEDPGRLSPDGTTIVTAGDGSIAVLDLDGTLVDGFSRRGDYLFGPAWSPDGEWIAYSGASVGPHADVFISKPDGTEIHRITDTPQNEILVEWSHPG